MAIRPRSSSGCRGDPFPVGVEADDEGFVIGEIADEPSLGQQDGSPGVVELERLALAGGGRVERHVRAPRLEHAEHAHEPLDRVGQDEADPNLGADAQGPQVMGEPVGAAVQCVVAQRAAVGDQRHGLGRPRRVRLEELGDEARCRPGRRGPAPLVEQSPPLGRGQDRELGEAPVGVCDDGLEQGLEVADHPVDRRGVEQVGVVLDPPGEAAGRLLQRQGQVELGGPRPLGGRQRPQGQLLPADVGHPVVLEDEHHLEERRPARVAAGLEGLDEQLEGQLLMLERPQRHLADAAEQRAEAGVARQVGPQRQHVDEEADQPFGLGAAPVGDRRADDDVVLAAVAVEQGLEGGQQRA